MLKCMIVDDDKMAQLSLAHWCEKEKDLELISSCGNVKEALETLEEVPVDVIFLDIEMPGGTGFELLDATTIMPHVVIISSKEKYAFEAFQYEVTDYLKKPISLIRFRQAIQKIRVEVEKQKNVITENIFIRSGGRYVQLKMTEIDFIENVGDYAKFVTENGNFLVYSTLKKLEKKLPSSKFMKVHRSFIVNLTKIKDIEDNTLVIKKTVIPISRSNKGELLDRIHLI